MPDYQLRAAGYTWTLGLPRVCRTGRLSAWADVSDLGLRSCTYARMWVRAQVQAETPVGTNRVVRGPVGPETPGPTP